jgi:hypothetical protein
VTIDELLLGVDISLGSRELASCPAIDRDGDGVVRIAELLGGVNAGLLGCPAAGVAPR